MKTTTEARQNSTKFRGGRMTKWKGRAASMSPHLGQIVLATALTTMLGATAANAQAVVWDDSGATDNWNETDVNWLDSLGTGPTTFTNDDDVIFDGFGETVTVDTTAEVNSITFDATGYEITGGTVELSGAAIVSGQTVTEINVAAGQTATISSTIAAGTNDNLGKTGTGTLTLSGSNTFNNLTVGGGILSLGSADAFNGTGNVIVGGGTLDLSGQSITTNSVIVQNGQVTSGTITTPNNLQLQNSTVAADIAGAGGITMFSGTVTLSGDSSFTGDVIIDAANEFMQARSDGALGSADGDTQITNGGTLFLRQTNAGADITIASESLSIAGNLYNISGDNTFGGPITLTGDSTFSAELGSLTVSGSVDLGANELTINDTGTTTTSGLISGTGSIVKDGTGTYVHAGVSVHTGGTTVLDGTMENTGTIVGDAVIGTVPAGASPELDNTGTIDGTVTVNAGLLDNNAGGNITGTVTTVAGTVQNAGIMQDVNNGASGTFTNEAGGQASAVDNDGGGSNAGTIASLTNDGTFVNTGTITGNVDTNASSLMTNNGLISGNTTINGASVMVNTGDMTGTVALTGTANFNNSGDVASTTTNDGGTIFNSGVLADVTNTTGLFANFAAGETGAVTNDAAGADGSGINSGTIASLDNTGDFTSNGAITGAAANSGTGDLDLAGTVGGPITNADDGAITVTGNLAASDTLTNSDNGVVNVNGGNLTGLSTLTNEDNGQIDIGANRTLSAGVINNNDSAVINVGENATLQGTSNTMNNASTINVAAGGTVTDSGDINNLATGVINFNGATGTADLSSTGTGQITNDGDINVIGAGSVAVVGDLTNQGDGTIDVTGGDMTGIGALVNSSDGVAAGGLGNEGINIWADRTLSAETLDNQVGGQIWNEGTVTVTGTAGADTFNNAGSIVNRGTLTSAGGLTNTGLLSSSGTTSQINAVTMDNSGVAFTEGDVTVTNTLTNTGTFTAFGISSTVTAGFIDNDANFNIGGNAPGLNFTVSGEVDTSGSFLTSGNGTFDNAVTVSGANGILGIYQDGTVTGITTLTNAGTNATGVLVNTDTSLTVATIVNGVGGSASIIENDGTLISLGTITNNAGATLNSNTTASVLTATSMLNEGTANVDGIMNGDVTNTGTDATFNVTTGLSGTGGAGNATGSFANADGATLNVDGGQMDITTLANSASGADVSTVNVDAGTTLNTTGVTNTISGTATVAEAVINVDGTLNTANGNVDNDGTIEVAGNLDAGTGTIDNDGVFTQSAGTTTAATFNTGAAEDTADVNIDGGKLDIAGTVTLTEGTVDVAAGGEVEALAMIVAADGVLDSNGLLDVDTITNNGTMTASGTGVDGIEGDVINTESFTADADLDITGNLTSSGASTTSAQAGTTDVSGDVEIVSTAAAGLDIAAGAGLEAENITLGDGTIATTAENAGDMTAITDLDVTAASVLNSDAAGSSIDVGGMFTVEGEANLANLLDGNMTNDGGVVNVTGDLAGTGGAASGTVDNLNDATLTLSSGSAFTLSLLTNDAASLVEMADGTIDGALTNDGTVTQSGAVTGQTINNNLIDLVDDATGDEFRAEGGLASAGSYGLDLDMALGAQDVDLLTVEGATTGNIDLQFNTFPGAPHLLDSPLLAVDVDEAAANDFTFEASGLETNGSPVSVFTIQDGDNADIFVQTGVSLSLGSLMEGVAQFEGAASQQAMRVAPHIEATCGGYGAWGRVNGGETVATAALENTGQSGSTEITTEYGGFEVGANLGCIEGGESGTDITYNILVGTNSGTTAQALTLDDAIVGTSTMEFNQLYLGAAATVTNGAFFADAQVRYGQTDYVVDNGSGAGGVGFNLTNDNFTAQTFTFAGSVNYAVPIGDTQFSVVPRAGVAVASTSVDDLSFDAGQTLATADYTTTSGMVGATLNYDNPSVDGLSGSNFFVGGTYYTALGAAQELTLTETNDVSSSLTSSGIEGYGEVSIGAQFSQALSNGGAFNAAIRADTRISGEAEGFNFALELGVRF